MTDQRLAALDRETLSAGYCVACVVLLVLIAIGVAIVYRLTGWPWLVTATLVLALLALLPTIGAVIHVCRAARLMR